MEDEIQAAMKERRESLRQQRWTGPEAKLDLDKLLANSRKVLANSRKVRDDATNGSKNNVTGSTNITKVTQLEVQNYRSHSARVHILMSI